MSAAPAACKKITAGIGSGALHTLSIEKPEMTAPNVGKRREFRRMSGSDCFFDGETTVGAAGARPVFHVGDGGMGIL
ncbi:hypothetical protein HLH36_11340 [Gluconacetobacter aggeris]|uniref:Uncharacterized protein n=1 Tax=Gluconacetobacter aggeris TaxID=1286186 RepID=A0A7W4NYU9_9PROT|nr:hypothetical protein [Gluconacetobacter aggeris]MBB2168943.1 hypothetical protein [Gluconacetobacter aggeris]